MDAYEGLFVGGIKKDTAEYRETESLLNVVGLNINKSMIEHELHDGFVRLPVFYEHGIDELCVISFDSLSNQEKSTKLSDEQKEALHKIYSMSRKNMQDARDEMRRELINRMNDAPNVKTFRSWWNNISHSISLTSAGVMVGYVNLTKYIKDLPEL
ncbi:MAG: hypothetical protein E7203_05440 [Selenomonas ruminantium]|jgi:hypothetical protein|uniref:Uncharacterized protein n=1 Tax=Selenomonas ruminantium TaxID=971 RepID=A0A927WI61_SELRU|nr:hypothetical protein [Selenomonas ruminantium]MBE6084901.1 hypothetical protein [Selenomonas ruminantium]